MAASSPQVTVASHVSALTSGFPTATPASIQTPISNPLNSQDSNQNQFGVQLGSDTYASDTESAIARAEYGDYQSIFQPLEGQLANMIGSTNYQSQQIGQTDTDFNNQFQASSGTNSRQLGRYGLTMTPDQTTSYNRLQNENQALGSVSATNRTQRGLRDQDYYLLSGGTLTAPTATGAQNLVTQGS